jgi:hypothetical protein
MPTAVDEGRGATLTLGTSTWDTAALIISIEFDEIARAALETTHLTTANARTYMPEDLPDYGSVTLEFLHIDSIAPPYAAAETVTITYPLGTGQAVPATAAFLGFLTNYKPGGAVVGELMKGTAKYKVTGVITFTAAT